MCPTKYNTYWHGICICYIGALGTRSLKPNANARKLFENTRIVNEKPPNLFGV